MLLVAGLVELAGFAAWWIANGEAFSWQRAANARAVAKAQLQRAPQSDGGRSDGDDPGRFAATHGIMVHPYLGYVHDQPKPGSSPLPISRFGFHGDWPIQQRSEDRFLVAVVGGSVALGFGIYAEEVLVPALRRSPSLATKSIEVFNLALGGYRQPQQLMTMQLLFALGAEFDCVINLDGFNEVALVTENVPLGVPSWYPRSWARLLDTSPSPDQLRRLGRIAILQDQRRARARSADGVWWSPCLQFLWQWRDRSTSTQLAELRQTAEREGAIDNPAAIGPGSDGQSLPAARRDMVSVWQRASRQLDALCRQYDCRYLHFLQPNQYVPDSKPIGAAERRKAIDPEHPWRAAVLHAYPLLQDAGRELLREGVAFHDLTMAFADHEEPLYADTCCHFGPPGHAILGERIAAAVRQLIELADVEIQRLVITPAEVELRSPLASERLRVVGIDAKGAEHDLSGAGFGTQVTVDPADAAIVGADGSVRAQRRGDALLHVRQGKTSATVALRAAWPDLCEGEDAVAGPSGTAPQIRIDPDDLAAPSGPIHVACTSMPEQRVRFLAHAAYPLPESPIGTLPFGLTLIPIASPGPQAKVRVPIPATPGQPHFLRFYSLDDSATTVTSASNTIVLTRR